jgi:hypothetical protein
MHNIELFKKFVKGLTPAECVYYIAHPWHLRDAVEKLGVEQRWLDAYGSWMYGYIEGVAEALTYAQTPLSGS